MEALGPLSSPIFACSERPRSIFLSNMLVVFFGFVPGFNLYGVFWLFGVYLVGWVFCGGMVSCLVWFFFLCVKRAVQ